MEKWEQIQGIYIHIPFCLQKCQYCDFASFSQEGKETMEKYTDKLCQDIKQHVLSLPISPQATIYFGGGTPSILPLPYLKKIVQTLKDTGLWQNPAEATIEANPGTVSLESLQAYKDMGFNRISFGVQSMQEAELKAMGRIHSVSDAVVAISMAKKAGFSRISADLIYGYPGQTLEAVTNSIKKVLLQGIKHLSVYGLVVEEGTPLYEKINTGELLLPKEDVSGDMYDFISTYLPQQQYKRYEISNYALAGEESQHNLLYWQYLPYLGFGVSACSFIGMERFTNVHTIEEYLQGVAPIKEELAFATRVEEYIFMGLRTEQGINFEQARKRFAIDLRERYKTVIEECLDKGLVQLDTGNATIKLTQFGMKFGNQVFEKFL